MNLMNKIRLIYSLIESNLVCIVVLMIRSFGSDQYSTIHALNPSDQYSLVLYYIYNGINYQRLSTDPKGSS